MLGLVFDCGHFSSPYRSVQGSFNGAPLLSTDKFVFKPHGSSFKRVKEIILIKS